MMAVILSYVLGLGPYIVLAVVLGFGLAAFAPWFWLHPERWLFFAICCLSLIGISTGGSGSEGSWFRQLTWGGLFVFCGARLVWIKDEQSLSRFKAIPVSLLLLVGFAFLSVVWSPVPMVSLRRFVQILGVLLIAMVVARQAISGRGLLEQITWPATIFMCLGLLYAAVKPGAAFDVDHALRAFSSHKNTWGQFSLLTALALSMAFLTRQRRRWLYLGLLGLAVVSLVASKSSTSILVFLMLAGLVFIWLALNRWGRFGKFGLVLGACLILLVAHAYVVVSGKLPFDLLADTVYSATGKNSTLSGRHHLWQLMFGEIARHPILGLGYGGFWTGFEGASGAVVSRLNWGPPSQAHSGYIDVLNEIGLVGVALLFVTLFAHLRRVLRLYRHGIREVALFHAALLLCGLVINYTESSLLRTTHIWWIVLCVSIIEVHVRLAILARPVLPQSEWSSAHREGKDR